MDWLNSISSKITNHAIEYGWFIALAIWGGSVNYLGRVKRSGTQSFSFMELVGEWAISGFAGLLTAYVCFDMNMSWHMTAFLAGMTGHLGARGLFIIENRIRTHLKGPY